MTDSDDCAGGAGSIREYDTGTVIYRKGDEGDTLYIVQRGMVALRRQRGKHEELEQIERGEFFGELSVINASPRDATATVVERSKLLEIDAPTFERMLQANAEIAVRIIRKMATRIDRLSRRPSSAEVRTALAAAAAAQTPEPSDPTPTTPRGVTEPPAYIPEASPSWGNAGQFQQPDPYDSIGHDLQANPGSPLKSLLLVLVVLAGVVGLIAAIALMNTGIN